MKKQHKRFPKFLSFGELEVSEENIIVSLSRRRYDPPYPGEISHLIQIIYKNPFLKLKEAVDTKQKIGMTGGYRLIGKTTISDNIFKCDYHVGFTSRDSLFNQTKSELGVKIDIVDSKFFPRILDQGTFINKFGCKCYWLIESNVDLKSNVNLKKKHNEQLKYLNEKYNFSDLYTSKKRIGLQKKSFCNFGICAVTDNICIYDFGL